MFIRGCILLAVSFILSSVLVPVSSLENFRQCILSNILRKDRVGVDLINCASVLKSFWPFTSRHSGVYGGNEFGESFDFDSDFETLTLKETGLEFLAEDSKLNINESFYFDENGDLAPGDLSPLQLVLAFVRDIKWISSGDKPQTGGLGIGLQESKEKPDWNFLSYRMKTLSEIEVRIYKLLKEYYESNPGIRPYPTLESYFKDMEASSLKALQISRWYGKARPRNWNPNSFLNDDPHLYIATHPLLIYRMIRRFALDLQPILFNLGNKDDNGLAFSGSLLEKANPDMEIFPNVTDLETTWKSLLRIQSEVCLNTYDFTRGKLENVVTGLGLNALQVLEMGMFYLEQSHFDYAIEWIHIASKTIKNSPIAHKFPTVEKFFNSCLAFAVDKHNSVWETNQKVDWDPGVFNSTVTIPFQPSSYVRVHDLQRPNAALNRSNTKWSASVKINFQETCAGKNLQTAKEKAALKCYNSWTKHPYWYINPLKLEVLHRDPPLYQIHTFIGDKLIAAIKERAKPNLERSRVADLSDPSGYLIVDYRTSSQCRIHDTEDDGAFMRPLTGRLEKLSGLVIAPLQAHDPYQVALYGPSHHYHVHTDAFGEPRRCAEKGDRVITMMGYLSETEVGGRTGFPTMGTFADPEKGSLIMWYNMRKAFDNIDWRTWHGGCPVVLGTKWITNKWVYSHMNTFTLKCGLSPEDDHLTELAQ